MFLINPIGMFINRRLHDWTADDRCRTYFHWFGGYIIFAALFSTFTMVAMAIGMPKLIGIESFSDFALIGVLLAFGAVIQTLIPSLNLLGKWISFTLLNLGALTSSLFFSILTCTTIEASAEHWLVGTLAGQVIFSVISYWFFFKSQRKFNYLFRPSYKQIKTLVSFSWPISIAVGLQWIYMQGYRFLMASRLDPLEFGLFAAGYTLAAALLAAFESLLTTWYRCLYLLSSGLSQRRLLKAIR
jgi:O-antigen/teichoic acid export membrane protein